MKAFKGDNSNVAQITTSVLERHCPKKKMLVTNIFSCPFRGHEFPFSEHSQSKKGQNGLNGHNVCVSFSS